MSDESSNHERDGLIWCQCQCQIYSKGHYKLSQSRNLPPHLSTNTHARLDIDALVAQLNMEVKACAKTYLAWLMQGTPVRCKKHLQRAMANMLSTILKPKTQCQAAIWPEMGNLCDYGFYFLVSKVLGHEFTSVVPTACHHSRS